MSIIGQRCSDRFRGQAIDVARSTNLGTEDSTDGRAQMSTMSFLADAAELERLINVHRAQGKGNESNALRLSGPLGVRRYSVLFRGSSKEFPASVAIKVNIDSCGHADSIAARKQFEAMERTHAALEPMSRWSVPEPYFVIPTLGVHGCEWIDGNPMTTLLFSWRTGRGRATELARSAGRWLRQFHGAGRCSPRRIETTCKLRGYLDEQESSLNSDTEFRIALRTLVAYSDYVANIELPASWLHGDFKTDNLMISAERIIGIDIQLAYEGASIHDIASFLNHLDLSFCSPRAWRQIALASPLRKAFLEGYGGITDDATFVALAWLRLHGLLAVWQEFVANPGSWQRRVWGEGCFKRLSVRLVRELAFASSRTYSAH